MSYLAFDTSTAYTTIALSNKSNLLLGTAENKDLYTQARKIIPLIQGVMQNAEQPFSALDAIYAIKGPGSFTGIRLGLATALGFKIAATLGADSQKKIQVKSISAFDVIACAVDHEESYQKYAEFPLLIILDTKRNDFFVQPFSIDKKANILRNPLSSPACLSKEEIISMVKSSKIKWLVAGHGLHQSPDLIEELKSLNNIILQDFSYATASRILTFRDILEKNNKFEDNLSPLYLRPAYVHEKKKDA